MDNFDISAIDRDEMNEDIEAFVLDDIAQFLTYLDPMHPLLENVIIVQSLGRDRGVKLSHERTNKVMAAVNELTTRITSKLILKSEEEKL